MKITILFILFASCALGTASESALIECAPRSGLPNFFAKVERGDAVRIGYFGGSITEQEGWRPKTLKWFQRQYPKANISQINAAIGGTGSDLGAFRLRHDMLDQKPDLLFVEFAVNDADMSLERICQTMESIVRQTWRDNPDTDICFVYTIKKDMLDSFRKGKLPHSYIAMEKVAEHYGIPSIDMGIEVARLEQSGQLIFKGGKPKTDAEKSATAGKIIFSPDGVHPYPDSGHELYLNTIVRGMNLLKSIGRPASHHLMEPLMADNWEHTGMIPLEQIKLIGKWKKLNPAANQVAKDFSSRLPSVWRANQPGDGMEFKFRGTEADIYHIIGPDCGQVVVTLDNQKPVVVPCFDASCTYYRLALLKIGSDLSNTVHSVKIEIHPDQPDKAKILSQRNQKVDDPRRFDDRAWYPGAVMLVGDLIK